MAKKRLINLFNDETTSYVTAYEVMMQAQNI